MKHICVSKLTTSSSDTGLSPGRHQAIICTNAGILLNELLVIKFCENFIKIHTFSLNKMHLKMSTAKSRPFCLNLNVLHCSSRYIMIYIYILLVSLRQIAAGEAYDANIIIVFAYQPTKPWSPLGIVILLTRWRIITHSDRILFE